MKEIINKINSRYTIVAQLNSLGITLVLDKISGGLTYNLTLYNDSPGIFVLSENRRDSEWSTKIAYSYEEALSLINTD